MAGAQLLVALGRRHRYGVHLIRSSIVFRRGGEWQPYRLPARGSISTGGGAPGAALGRSAPGYILEGLRPEIRGGASASAARDLDGIRVDRGFKGRGWSIVPVVGRT